MKPTDTQLMTQFTKQTDQAAFTQLVERYVDIAYAAAITYLGKDDLARDACQLTFLELSRKAAHFPATVKLGGWVYATSRNLSRNILRGEIRRQKREQTYADQMKPELNTAPDWSQLAPEIHEALETLKPADRDLVILRFFQKKSHAEVGKSLGISTDAARMKLNRALSRLSQKLSNKGITSTAAALAAALPAHAMITAPTGLATSISTAVLAGAGTLSLITLTTSVGTFMKAKTIIIASCATATLLVGGVYIAKKSNPETVPPASLSNMTKEASSPLKNSEKPRAQGDQTASPRSAEPWDDNAQTNHMAPATLSHDPQQNKAHPSSLIDPNELRKAEQFLSMMELVLSMKDTDNVVLKVEGRTKDEDVTTLIPKLQLRLGLDAEQMAHFETLLSENARRQKEAFDPQKTIKTLLAADRTLASEYIAIGAMGKNNKPLSPELQEYAKSIIAPMSEHLDVTSESIPEWGENEELLSQLREPLNEEQRSELDTYLNEQVLRKSEKNAYDRSSKIATQLGLNEEDRGALYDYLYQNPAASQEDLEELLSPELHKLLK